MRSQPLRSAHRAPCSAGGPATFDGETTIASLEGLTPDRLYRVELVARDEAGNESAPSLTETFTLSGDTSLSDREVYDGLYPTCNGCHSQGGTPFFQSLDDFQRLVVNDVSMVTPGALGASLFIRALEGEGEPPWSTMPLGSLSFNALSARGETLITMAEVRAWIESMKEQ